MPHGTRNGRRSSCTQCQFANADGVLPLQFDGLVRESFSELIQTA